MSLAQRFTSSLIWNSIGKAILYCSGIATSIIIARGLGKVNLGIYATLITIPAMLRLFSSLGFETIFNLKLPVYSLAPNGRDKMRYLIQRLIGLRLFITIIILGSLYMCFPLIGKFLKKPELIQYFLPLALYFVALTTLSLISMIFLALLRMKVASIVDGFNQMLYLGGILILVWFLRLGIDGVLYAFVISTITTICVYMVLGKEYVWGKTTSIEGERRELVEIGATALVSSMVTFGLGSQIDILLLNYFGVSNEDIGVYHLGYSLALMLGLFSQGIGGISQSVFSEAYTRQDDAGLSISWTMVTKVFIIMALPIYMFALLHAYSIFKIFYGVEYVGTSGILQLFIISTALRIIIGSSFCMPAFYLLQQKRNGVYVQIAGGVVNLILDVLLIPLYGVWGAVWATSFSLVMTGIGQVVILSRKIEIVPPFVFAGKIMIACTIALLPTFFFEIFNVYLLLAAGLVYGILFILTIAVLKPLDEQEKEMVKAVSPQFAAVVRYF
jgi:O-antigen/teichoic acid export membrane protein